MGGQGPHRVTVLIYRDGTMAADTATFRGDFITSTTARKIIRTPRGALVGCAGELTCIDRFNAWAMTDFDPNLKPDPFPRTEKDEGRDFGAIVAFPDGRVLEYHDDLEPGDVSGEPWVIEGCAQEFIHALATLGWDAKRIIAHVIEHCVWAGGEVYALTLEEPAAESEDDEPLFEEVPDSGVFGARVWTDPKPDAAITSFLEKRGL